jgi:peptide/nickel transport system ATP-binding protein
MYAGRIIEQAGSDDLFARPAHPYTRGLLAALPDMVGPRRRLAAIPGGVPEPFAMPPGCPFAPRCAEAGPDCDAGVPSFRVAGENHVAACVRVVAPEYAPA